MNSYIIEEMGRMGNKRDEYKESNKHLFRGFLVSNAIAGNLHRSVSVNSCHNTVSSLEIDRETGAQKD